MMEMCSEEALKYVWEGAIPIQVHLHESEVTTLPRPPPAMALAPRAGYLPLLIPQIKPYFDSALPPGLDTVWFDYKGVPLKWYIPTGVLFDLLCAEPERPWNLTVHFRGYPADSLTPCASEEAVKWSFINSMKEAAYIINGNCKSIMNMSQADQYDLWQSMLNGDLENYSRVVSRLKFGTLMEDCKTRTIYRPQQVSSEAINSLPNQTGRIPVRLYIRNLEETEDLVDSWEKISFLNRPMENRIEDGLFTLRKAMESLLPELFQSLNGSKDDPSEGSPSSVLKGADPDQRSRIRILRIQGIAPSLDTPFAWVANNLAHPDLFLHICIFVSQS
ncbi:autophagy protein Apg5 family [Wolffia australiana]